MLSFMFLFHSFIAHTFTLTLFHRYKCVCLIDLHGNTLDRKTCGTRTMSLYGVFFNQSKHCINNLQVWVCKSLSCHLQSFFPTLTFQCIDAQQQDQLSGTEVHMMQTSVSWHWCIYLRASCKCEIEYIWDRLCHSLAITHVTRYYHGLHD